LNIETDIDDGFVAYDPIAERKAKIAHVVKVAAELGTRGTARRMGISKNTVTDYLRLTNGIEPSTFIMRVQRKGPRGFVATASGMVRQVRGKTRTSVRFSCTVEAVSLLEVLEALMHEAFAAAAKKAGLPDGG
jgi:hypothetical protein